MDVLLINKFFFPLAGAETAFLHTRELLLNKGHRVIDFSTRDDRNLTSEQAGFFAPARSFDQRATPGRLVVDSAHAVYSLPARRALSRLLDATRPSVAHLHNIYHHLTLSIVDELHSRDIPIVQTLHDYKIACPAYTLFTEGAPCHRCVRSTVLHAVRHRCIKGSIAGSSLGALELALARRRKTYDRISLFLAPSAFAASVASDAGIDPERIRVLPYFIPDVELAVAAEHHPRAPIIFFAGRLAETKGVKQLLDAFRRITVPAVLRIAGWGPLAPLVEEAARHDPRIEFLGSVPRDQLLAELGSARALVLPSIWEDNCPLVMLEARARATPIIVSNRGGPPEFVEDGVDGFVVDPTDTTALADRLELILADAGLAGEVGDLGRQRLLREHGADKHYKQLMAAYNDAGSAT